MSIRPGRVEVAAGISRMSAPWYPTIGATRSSSRAKRRALETILPVMSVTITPRDRARLIASARVRPDDSRSSPTSVPSMSSATMAMGRMGWGVMIAGTFLMMPDRGRARWRGL